MTEKRPPPLRVTVRLPRAPAPAMARAREAVGPRKWTVLQAAVWICAPVTLAALWLALWLLSGCAHAPAARVAPPPMGHWAAEAYPIELRLSSALTPCQRAGVRAAVEWWRVTTGAYLFTPRDVPHDDPVVLGIPLYGAVGVAPGAMASPDVVAQNEVSWIDGAPGHIHSATITVQGCSVRGLTHELGHVLGLSDDPASGWLMSLVHDGDSWEVSESEAAGARGEWWASGP